VRQKRRQGDLQRALIGTALAGAVVGAIVSAATADHFATPQPVDPDRWQVLTPGTEQQARARALGRGTHIVDGALTITRHVFHQSDTLLAQVPSAVGGVELSLAPDSGPLRVTMGTDPPTFLRLGTDRFTATGMPVGWVESPERSYALRIADGALTIRSGDLERTVQAGQRAGRLELATVEAPARVEWIRLLDTEGVALLEVDYRGWRTERSALLWGTVAGSYAGLALGLVALGPRRSGWGVGLALAALPALVAVVPAQGWLALVERLYLIRTPAWIAARWGLIVSLLPLLAAAMLALGPLSPGRGRREAWLRLPVTLQTWAALAVVAVGLSWQGPLSAAGILLLIAPAWVLRGGDVEASGWLLRDLPALGAVAALGWGPGLLVATLWRLLVVWAWAGTLLRAVPRPAADYLLMLTLTLPIGAESLLRATYVGEIWRSERLGLGGDDASALKTTWSERCGEPEGPRVAFNGGSSTGGAYQFWGEPEAFFAAQAHAALCEVSGVETVNHGQPDQNTFTIARTAAALLQGRPDVLVLYVGVNDLLTRRSRLTRREREALLEQRQAGLRGLTWMVDRSRLITGLGLLLRPSPQTDEAVSEVPLEDARDNLTQIAALAETQGTRVVLLTELVTRELRGEMEPYGQMQRAIAAAHENVIHLDVSTLLSVPDPELLLIDRNHLSREGNARLGVGLASEIAGLLGWPREAAAAEPDEIFSPTSN